MIQTHGSPGIFSNHRNEPHARATETQKRVQIPEPGVCNCSFCLFTLHEKICGCKLVAVVPHRTAKGLTPASFLSRVFPGFAEEAQQDRAALCSMSFINRHKASRGLLHFRLFPEHTVMPSLRSRRSRATDWKSRLHLIQNADRGKPAPAGPM